MDKMIEAASPFLPGTNIQYAWDSTSLGYLKTCPRLYQYTMIKGWASHDESVHLRFGIELHHCIQDYELGRAAGLPHWDAVHDAIRELLIRSADFVSDHKLKNRPFLIRTMVWYFDQFETDPAETLILDTDKPAVEVSFRFELEYGPESQPLQVTEKEVYGEGSDRLIDAISNPNRQPYLLCGHLDRVVTFGGETFIVDHKTTSTTPGQFFFNQFEPNNQISLYTIASKVIFGSLIHGVIIDAVQIGVNFSRFTRGFTYRTQDQLTEWLTDLKHWLRKAEGYATEGYWPMNDTACDKFGGCRFREICSKSPGVRENFLKGNFTKLEEKDRWNPLKSR